MKLLHFIFGPIIAYIISTMGRTLIQIILLLFMLSAPLYSQDYDVTDEVRRISEMLKQMGFDPSGDQRIKNFLDTYKLYRFNDFKRAEKQDALIDAELFPYVDQAIKEELGFDLKDQEVLRKELYNTVYDYILPVYRMKLALDARRIKNELIMKMYEADDERRGQGGFLYGDFDNDASSKDANNLYLPNTGKVNQQTVPEMTEEQIPKMIQQQSYVHGDVDRDASDKGSNFYFTSTGNRNQPASPTAIQKRVADIEYWLGRNRKQISSELVSVEKALAQLSEGAKTYVTTAGSELGLFTIMSGGLSDATNPVPKYGLPKMYVKEEIYQYAMLLRQKNNLQNTLKEIDAWFKELQIYKTANIDKAEINGEYVFLSNVEKEAYTNYVNMKRGARFNGPKRALMKTGGHVESSIYMLIALALDQITDEFTKGYLRGPESVKRYSGYTHRTFFKGLYKDYSSGGIYVGFMGFPITGELVSLIPTSEFILKFSKKLDAYTAGVGGTMARGVMKKSIYLAAGLKGMQMSQDAYDFRWELFSTEDKQLHDLAVDYYLKKNITTWGAWSQLASSMLSFATAEIIWAGMKYPFKKKYMLHAFNRIMQKKAGIRCDDYHTRIMLDQINKAKKEIRMSEGKLQLQKVLDILRGRGGSPTPVDGKLLLYYFWQRWPWTAMKAIGNGYMIFKINGPIQENIMFSPGEAYYEGLGKIVEAMAKRELEAFSSYLALLAEPADPMFKAIMEATHNPNLLREKQEGYIDYIFDKYYSSNFMHDVIVFIKENSWAHDCLFYNAEKENGAEKLESYINSLYSAVTDPYNYDAQLETVKANCTGNYASLFHAPTEESKKSVDATLQNIGDQLKKSNGTLDIGKLYLPDSVLGKYIASIPEAQSRECFQKMMGMGNYVACYEDALKERGVWTKQSSQCLKDFYCGSPDLYSWMDKLANRALNDPIDNNVFYSDEHEYMFGPNGILSIEVGNDACGTNVKRMMQLFLKILPDMYDPDATEQWRRLDFMHLVADAIYLNMKKGCGYVKGAQDQSVFNKNALADLYAVVNYIEYDRNKTQKELMKKMIKNIPRAQLEDIFKHGYTLQQWLMIEILIRFGLYTNEPDFWFATGIGRDYPPNEALFKDIHPIFELPDFNFDIDSIIREDSNDIEEIPLDTNRIK